MKYFAEGKNYKIANMSCLDYMDLIPENYFDSIVCDPPYEIGFMNKKWDNTGIAFSIETWKKALRVLKPGGYLLAFNHSRTFHRMMVAIEDAGFELRDTIMWLYGSGFPKSHNISKAIDKSFGTTREEELEFAIHIKNQREKADLTLKEFNKIFGYVAGCNWWESENPNNYRVPNQKDYKILISKYNVDNRFQKIVDRWYPKGKKIGEKIRGNAGFSNEQVPRKWKEQIGEKMDLTELVTPEAKQWDGYGTALKPAFEPIVMARKPFKTTVAENVLKYGTGGININECRINTNELKIQKSGDTSLMGGLRNDNSNGGHESIPNENGRFPANIIHDGSEETIKDMYDYETDNDTSRYFYCAKASVKDRDEGLDEFNNGIITDGREKSIDNAYNRGESVRKNIHPTVKPTELMQYLVRLVTPKGGKVLDPFMGSGSTGKATMIENVERDANYHFIGIDLEKEYCEISKARIEWGINYKEIEKEKSETSTFFDEEGIVKIAKQEKLF